MNSSEIRKEMKHSEMRDRAPLHHQLCIITLCQMQFFRHPLSPFGNPSHYSVCTSTGKQRSRLSASMDKSRTLVRINSESLRARASDALVGAYASCQALLATAHGLMRLCSHMLDPGLPCTGFCGGHARISAITRIPNGRSLTFQSLPAFACHGVTWTR